MTTTTAGPAAAEARKPRRVSVARGYRFELVKLLAQWRIRILIALCWIGPAVAVIVVSSQGTLPADTLFGRQMHATGWGGALVVLSFAGSWFFPMLTSIVAGDVFSSEDRLGTWRHLLVAVRSPRRIFAAKALASLTVLMLCVPGLAVSGIAGGLVVGSRALTGLDGHQLTAGDVAGRLLLAWLCALAPVLAFAAIGLLASVIFGRSPVGLLLPAFGGLGMELASQTLSMPAAVRVALPSFAFMSWDGLFTSPPQLGSLISGVIVSLAWAAVATALAYWLFVRRDFATLANDGSMRRAILLGILPLLGAWALCAGAVAAATGATGSGVDAGKLQRSLAASFAHIYPVQYAEVDHLHVTAAQLRATASCVKGSGLVAQEGPGNDWRCYVYWHLPGAGSATGQAVYQLDVSANGRYVADGDGPNSVNGYFMVRVPYGDAP
ncbi:MAG: ABC transporter permease, partial [Streptosporangiales bacterium]|nr:ABC transporter permease [Streptosporangiales bacterium]